MHTDFYTLTISFVHTQLTNSFPFAELAADICCLTRWAASDHASSGGEQRQESVTELQTSLGWLLVTGEVMVTNTKIDAAPARPRHL